MEGPADARKVDEIGLLLGLKLVLDLGLVGGVRGGSGSLWVAWALCSLLFAFVVFVL